MDPQLTTAPPTPEPPVGTHRSALLHTASRSAARWGYGAAARTVAVAVALVVATAGCGLASGNAGEDSGTGADQADEEVEEESEPGAAEPVELPVSSATTSTSLGPYLEIEVRDLERVGDGLLLLTLGVGNHTDEDIRRFDLLSGDDGDTFLEDQETASGVTLLDAVNHQQHLNLTVSEDGTCLCSKFDHNLLRAGVVEELRVAFPAPPEDVDTMSVLTPITPPFLDVPISDGEPLDAPELEDGRVLALHQDTDEVLGGTPEEWDDGGIEDGVEDGTDSGGEPTGLPEMEAELESLGSVTGSTEDTENLAAEVNEVRRDAAGEYVVVTWTVHNDGAEDARLGWDELSASNRGYEMPSFAGVTLTDHESDTVFHPVMNEQTLCLCSRGGFDGAETRIPPSHQVTYWSLYKTPADVRTATVTLNGFGQVTEVPVGV
ncbi:hypothetical protein [Nocardiopsis nanhaiensis]